MVETEAPSIGFNKRRAEGRDKSDIPQKNLRLKVRKLNPANTISYVQILGTGMDTQDTSPSVLLFFDKQRFIFNAGEGLQRFCTEHKIKLSKIDHIFLSRVCSETAGGLPGLLLTLAGIGEEGMSVNVWGPSDFKYLVDAMRSFIPNAAMVHTRSFGPALGSNMDAALEFSKFYDPIVLVDDEVVKISAILVRPSSNREPFHEDNVAQSKRGIEESTDHDFEAGSPTIKALSTTVKPGDMSVVYVCELPEIKGKFDPLKAAAFGLKPGPKYRDLQLGNSVMSDRQNIMVHPSDVLGPSVPGPIVLLVDCPTESHLLELTSLRSLRAYHKDFSSNQSETSKAVTCVIHLSPASIVGSPNYQKWMKNFGSAEHIMAGHERKNVKIPILKSSARIAARLNYLCPQLFPAPGFWTHQQLPFPGSDSDALNKVQDSNLCESILAENLLKFTLRPYANLGLDRSSIPRSTSFSEIINELHSEIPEIVDAAQHISQLWHGSAEADEKTYMEDCNVMVEEPWLNENSLPSCLENIRRDDLEIVLLGTGSSQPSKYRNVSSIYINLFSKGSILLDCGEGSLGQLKRRYGVEGADAAVRSLRCIWISHIHADHHAGLARILALRRDLLMEVPHEPLLVIGPRQLKRYLDAYQRLEDLDMQFLDCKHTTQASLDAFEDVAEQKDHSPSRSSIGSTDTNTVQIDGGIAQKIASTLFAKGSRMQSYWKGPGSPTDSSAVVPLLKCLNNVLGEAGLEALISFPVVHCPQSYGVILRAVKRVNSVGKEIPGWKIVYSGDTRPCPELVEASRGATILIHEATFEDSLVDEAIAKNHSTTTEAIDIGNSAGVYRIILTHFSQRYPKIPVVEQRHMHKTCIAFDLMSVNVADLSLLPFANYAASDDEEDQPSPQPPTQLLSNFPAPTRSLPLSSSSLFPSLPPPKSSSLFQSLPKPKQSSNPTNEELEDSNSINSSSIFSSLPRPKGNPPNPSNSLANPLIDPTELASILPQPKRVVLFKLPVNPSSLNLSEEDDDDDDEEAERRRRKGSESSFQTPSVTSFLSSIPAPKNSATLGILPSSGSGRRSILETGVPVSLKDSGLTQNVDNRSANYDSSVNYSSGVDQNVDNHRESNDNSVNDDSGAGQYGWNYENYDGYGNYQYAGDQNVVGEAQSGSISSNTEYVSYENYGNYGDYGQYGTNPAGPSEIVNDGTYVIAENSVRIPEKRRRNEVPTEILEVNQDELIKNRPREDQVKLTGIAFGPSYQPASTKGKPSKLHKRKHQINSLFFDMKQKEMELAERRSRGLLTKAETQAKYGW